MAKKKTPPSEAPPQTLWWREQFAPTRADAEFTTTETWPDAQPSAWRIEIIWGRLSGRFEPVGLLIEAPPGRPVAADELRRLPLGGIMGDARKREGKSFAEDAKRETYAESAAEVNALATAFTATPGRARMQLSEVADVYREAYAVGDSPKKAVAEKFGLSISGAAKRVMAARKAGYLPPAVRGKAGWIGMRDMRR